MVLNEEEHVSKKFKGPTLAEYSELTRISEYEVFAASVAIYKRVSVPRNLSYLYCGVVEEFCEFKGGVKTLDQALETSRKGSEKNTNGSETNTNGSEKNEEEKEECHEERLAVLKELGDVTWYLSAMCNELCVGLDTVVQLSDHQLETKSEVPAADLAHVLDQVLLHIGTIGGKIKKSIRDDNEVMTHEKEEIIVNCIKEIFSSISHKLCPTFGSTLLHVMQLNVDKAASRFARGVVQGDGDNR